MHYKERTERFWHNEKWDANSIASSCEQLTGEKCLKCNNPVTGPNCEGGEMK